MNIIKQNNITDDIIKDIISDESKQPYIRDETICCLDSYNGCCCKCRYQLSVYSDLPISSLFCYVCLKPLDKRFLINPTHGHCFNYNPKQ